MPRLCMPCEKGNCGNCLIDVVDPGQGGIVIECECSKCGYKCDTCGGDCGEPCDHDRQLCADCKNECRACEDEAGRDEAAERQLEDVRGGSYDLP